MTEIIYNLTPLGGPARISAAELTRLAAEAKTEVQAGPRGWERLSPVKIIALAWFADRFLQNAAPVSKPAATPKPVPVAISDV